MLSAKIHGDDIQTLMQGVTGPMTVRVYHEKAQPDHPNKCDRSNCEHLCLPKDVNAAEKTPDDLPFTCACESGFRVSVKNTSVCLSTEALAALIKQRKFDFRNPYLIKFENSVKIN